LRLIFETGVNSYFFSKIKKNRKFVKTAVFEVISSKKAEIN